jgi:uncharacterized membrane protein YjjP (DUF1212 family)
VPTTAASGADDDLVPTLRDLLVQLGLAMSAAGDSVDAIGTNLRAIVRAYRVDHVEVGVLPTSLMVGTGQGTDARVQMGSPTSVPLRFDQVAALYALVRSASTAALTPAAALDELDAIRAMPPTFGAPVRTFGHAVMTTGLALLLQPTWGAVVAAFALGLLVGLLKLPSWSALEFVLPVAVSFVVSAVVFVTLRHLAVDNPARILIPPLATFLPGGALAIATVELASGQMVSGASRLVSGLVQLMLLAFGILAAGQLLDLPPEVLTDNPVARLGWWAPWVGVLVFAVGNWLHLSSPARSLPWILAVLLAAYTGQVIGAALFGGLLSGFFGALAMTPLVLWFETLPHGPPKLVTFLPAFWLLVPGATGLIGVTALLGDNDQFGAQATVDTLVTVMSIALGVLVGTALHRVADEGFRGVHVG